MFTTEQSVLVIIDVQGRLAGLMHNRDGLYEHIRLMIQAAGILQVPILWLEQYPKGLGSTVPEVAELLDGISPIEKTSFSAMGSDEFVQALSASGRTQCVITGIESHVCVYQTVLDLLQRGHSVAVNQQAVSSRLAENRLLGLQRMQQAGAVICSTEMILFEWMRTSKHPQFRQISALLK